MKSGAYLAEMNSKWPKLQELYKVLFGHSFEGAHNAMADVVATKDCFWEMVRLRKILLSSSSRNNAVMNYDDNVDLPFSDEEKRGNESPHLVLMAVYLSII